MFRSKTLNKSLQLIHKSGAPIVAPLLLSTELNRYAQSLRDNKSMKTLRQSTIDQILMILDRSLFTRHGFDSSFNTSKSETVKIVYKEDPMYHLEIKESSWGKQWNVTECPGITFTDSETTEVEDFSAATKRIEGWIQRILEEYALKNKTEHFDFTQMRESLKKSADSLKDPEIPFSEEESESWKVKLDNLVKKFEELKEEKKVQQAELQSLKKEVSILKKQVGVVPKDIWVKSAGNKILRSL